MKVISFASAMFVIAFALSACTRQISNVDLYGQSALASAAERTIVITPATKYVNVEGGQIVRFIVGDKDFAWNFNIGRTTDSFDLNAVAPPGVLNHVVRAFVSPDPKYIGGGDHDK